MRLDPDLFCGEMEARRAVQTIAIEQRHRRHSQVRAHRDQFLGKRSPFEKAERGAGMELNVHQLPVASFQLSGALTGNWQLATGNCSSHTFLLQTSFCLACPAPSDTMRALFPAARFRLSVLLYWTGNWALATGNCFRRGRRCPTPRATSLPVPTSRRKSA